MNLEKWIPLWNKCPELRPMLSYQNGHWAMGFGENMSRVATATEEIAAILIRDRAFAWLAAHDHDPMLYNAMTAGIEHGRSIEQIVVWAVVLCGDGPEDDHPEFVSHDQTEALYMACCKALGLDLECKR